MSQEQKNKMIYLIDKNETILLYCFNKCNHESRKFKTINGKQATCIQNCSSKTTNAYSLLFDAVNNGGVNRAPPQILRSQSIGV